MAETLREPLAWEAMTLGYIRFISERKYQALRPYARKWYRPICARCGPAIAAWNTRVTAEGSNE